MAAKPKTGEEQAAASNKQIKKWREEEKRKAKQNVISRIKKGSGND
jgi:hypothetical protein